jgi:hypothetical protein
MGFASPPRAARDPDSDRRSAQSTPPRAAISPRPPWLDQKIFDADAALQYRHRKVPL